MQIILVLIIVFDSYYIFKKIKILNTLFNLIISRKKLLLDYSGLRYIYTLLQNIQPFNQYEVRELYTKFADYILLESIQSYYCYLNEKSEYNLRKKVIEKFNTLFPNYKLIKQEYTIKNKLRIDILAYDNISKRQVIFELKKGNFNPNKQLSKYAQYFNNPILICISEECVKDKKDNIKYLLFSELNIL
jgi:hypothetical protein